MPNTLGDLGSGVHSRPLLLAAFGLWACSGPDNLTDPVVSADTVSLGGTMNVAGASSVALGGTVSTLPSGGTQSGTTAATPFDWGATVFDASAGNAILYQDHMNGMGCINAACHGATTFTANASGTVYQADGTTYASNVQLGVFIDGALGTTYAGTMGNFYVTLPSATNWATAQIALRTATGSVAMPVNTAATGNCNSCHDATNRIVTP